MAYSSSLPREAQTIAVIGSGIAGMSAAWLLSQKHRVTLYERNERLGGHSNTVVAATRAGPVPVDTGFIVYNDVTYPNLVALFQHLGVATKASDMSFGVSLRGGAISYSSVGVDAFLAGGRNAFDPRFWSMARDLLRFYRDAPRDIHRADMSLGDYLAKNGYGAAFQNDHILPQAAAIWSASIDDIADYPVRAFVRFFENHGLLKLKNRPEWRTVEGGSRAYVEKLTAGLTDIRLGAGAVSIQRKGLGAWVRDANGRVDVYDHVVIAAHADHALTMLDDASPDERALLGAFRYTTNRAVLHTDAALMPHRRAQWASWNYVGENGGCVVSYWMNRLQRLPCTNDIFLTLNPQTEPQKDSVIYETTYEHPLFDGAAMAAQQDLWRLQGVRNTWFCGAHFGAGFHEDGLQSGLAVAEQLGGVRRPWQVENESGRIHVKNRPAQRELAA
ncbi:NAD(P)/FAD-dependent oxidoreductase [Terricaulis sp.]|uniref:NAD(P)/FAD-dependent oxidoreductase n=1 Tax=Terricaulis sp. TaxID=2768686 RepID=UPI0037852C19